MSEQSVRRPVRAVALGVGAILIAFLVVLAVTHSGAKESAESNLLGKPAPMVEAELLGGGKFNLSYRKGSWVILNFFNLCSMRARTSGTGEVCPSGIRSG